MWKKFKRRLGRLSTAIITDTLFNRKRRASPSSPPTPPPPATELPLPPAMPNRHKHHPSVQQQRPFIFPTAQSSVVPDPSRFFSPHLLSSPLPTNSFFQNFVLKNGDQPEYIHPYLVKSASGSLSISYPTRFATPSFIYQVFKADLSVSAAAATTATHVVSSFHDLSVTLDLPPHLRFFLVRGSPFVTFTTLRPSVLSFSTIHAVTSFSSNDSSTKHTVSFNNGQTYLIYASSPLVLVQSGVSLLAAAAGDEPFSGVVRIACLPDPEFEPVLDRFSSCYPISGDAEFFKPFTLSYRWDTKGWGDLLLLAHPLHLKLLDLDEGCAAVLDGFTYRSIDGDLVGVVGDSWVLKTEPISVAWHSTNGLSEEGYAEVVSALAGDVAGLSSTPIATTSSYFYGKAIARAARLALIAEEAFFPDAIPAVREFLKKSISPWLDGSFDGNGFLYDPKWGGLQTRQGSSDSGADFGFSVYNDHHYHLGYFLYAIAVLCKVDHSWGRKYRAQAYALMADFMNLSRKPGASYARLRCFDLWKLHSWAGGLTEFADGRNQESTSEAVNGYYSAALMGLAYGDTHLVSVASTVAALEMDAAATWWHVRRDEEGMYEEEFRKENRVVGVLWANKRDSGLWFAPPEWRECRLGIQLLPLLPITEVLFRDAGFARELVEWASPALAREGVGEGWKGFVYVLEGVYDKASALEKTKGLKGFDDGNSLSNLLWWLHSRWSSDDDDDGGGFRRCCWFRHYH